MTINPLMQYPNLIKYLPDWLNRFYPSLAQFAKGEGYPCGNKGVFIPRRSKCWTHPKTGQRLKTPLTYQKYQEAKVKSQRSRTEKGRTALDRREQELRQKNKGRIKNAINLIGDGTHDSVPRNAQEYYEMMIKKGKNITMQEASETVMAIQDWSGSSMEIKDLQRKGIYSPEAENIEKFVKNSTPFKGEIYRGLAFENEEKAMQWLTKNNGVVEHSSHASWTSRLDKAEQFADAATKMYHNSKKLNEQPVIIKSINKTGASVQNLSFFPDEAEVILTKGSSYKITNITKKAGMIVAEAVEILK